MLQFPSNLKIPLLLIASICIFGCDKKEISDRPSNTTRLYSNQNLNRDIETNDRFTENIFPSGTQDSYKGPTTSWQPQGSEFIYHQDGTSSWQPHGSEFIYHQDGTSSWQPQGSEFIYRQDGTSSWQPQGSEYIYNQD
jgi:hypothetical protein